MKTIFLVDDSATILLSISNILAKAGYATEKASSGEEALKKFQAGIKIDLLITDLNMPGINGIELIKAAGASGWIVKPATADELINTIKLVVR